MKPKYGVVRTSAFNKADYHGLIQDSFQDIVVDGIDYKMVYAFDKYLKQGLFNGLYSTASEYAEFLSSTQWQITHTDFDWENDKVKIVLSNGIEHEFECTTEWTINDVIGALNSTLD